MRILKHEAPNGRAILVETGWTDDVRKIFNLVGTQLGTLERSSVGGIVYTVRDLDCHEVARTHTVWQAISAAVEEWGAVDYGGPE